MCFEVLRAGIYAIDLIESGLYSTKTSTEKTSDSRQKSLSANSCSPYIARGRCGLHVGLRRLSGGRLRVICGGRLELEVLVVELIGLEWRILFARLFLGGLIGRRRLGLGSRWLGLGIVPVLLVARVQLAVLAVDHVALVLLLLLLVLVRQLVRELFLRHRLSTSRSLRKYICEYEIGPEVDKQSARTRKEKKRTEENKTKRVSERDENRDQNERMNSEQ